MEGIMTPLASVSSTDQHIYIFTVTIGAEIMVVFPHQLFKILSDCLFSPDKPFKASYIHRTILKWCKNFYNHLKIMVLYKIVHLP